MIDISKNAEDNSSYELSVEDFNEFKTKIGGEFPPKSVLLIRTGWSKYWPDAEKYLGHKTDTSKLRFPGLSLDAATLIALNKNVVGVGIDTASMDFGESTEFLVHRMLQRHGKYILENVASLNYLVGKSSFKLTVSPMKIQGGTGSPCRIFASVDISAKDEF